MIKTVIFIISTTLFLNISVGIFTYIYTFVLFFLHFLKKNLETSTMCMAAFYLTTLKSVSLRVSQLFLTHFSDTKQ